MIQPSAILHHLLSILDVPSDRLTAGNEGVWDSLFTLAKRQRIYHPLAGLILKLEPEILPPPFPGTLRRNILANAARNAGLSLQIVELARLFRGEGIPVVFFKGSACLVRGVYPTGWRFMSDIDVLAPEESVMDAFSLLERNGYFQLPGGIRQIHHLPTLNHPGHVGAVELHTEPYQLETPGFRMTPELRKAAEELAFFDEPVLVPNPTDHLWILMRTDAVERASIPRLFDVIECGFFAEKGLAIDSGVFARRMETDMMPNLVSSLSRSCNRFLGMEPFAGWDEGLMARWEAWSVVMERREKLKPRLHCCRRRFAAVMFLPGRGINAKIGFGVWLMRRLALVDRFTPGPFRVRSFPAKTLLYGKLVLTFLMAGMEYILFLAGKSIRSG